MLIEFVGLPGAGKTTMSRRVTELLLDRQLTVDETTYDLSRKYRRLPGLLVKSTYLTRYAVAHPRLAFSDSVGIAATQQATLLDLGKSIFNWMFIASLTSRKRSPARLMILDQGVAQAMWSIGFAAQRETWLDELCARAQTSAHKPDLLIHVRADFQKIGDRLATRAQRLSRMDSLGWDHNVLQRAEAHGDAIIGRFKSFGVPVIDVKNDDREPLASGARRVADAIVTKLGEQRFDPAPRFDTMRRSDDTRCHGPIIS